MSCHYCSQHPNQITIANSDRVGKYTLLPRLEELAMLGRNINHLIDVDPDSHLPSEYNFNYYSTHELNCNIRSLSANFDALVNLLSELYFPFSVISISETKFKVDHDFTTNTRGHSRMHTPASGPAVISSWERTNYLFCNISQQQV